MKGMTNETGGAQTFNLLASIGTSPGVLTNTVWALAHQKKPVVHNT